MKRCVCAALLLCLFLAGCAGQAKEEALPLLILRYGDNQPEDYPTTKAAEYYSEVEVLQLPFLYNDAEHMWRVLDGPIGEKFLTGARRAGIIGLSWFDAGARSFYTRWQIGGLADLRGLTIRVQESTLMSRMVELLGAKPVQIPYNDVYSALQTAKIEGAENNWPSYAATGHFQAAPYYLQDEHSRLPEMQIMSTVALDKIAEIDEDYVTIVRECARECAIYERELWRQEEADSEQLVRDYGCVVTTLTDAQLEEFRRAVQPMYEEYSDEDQALIQQIRNS